MNSEIFVNTVLTKLQPLLNNSDLVTVKEQIENCLNKFTVKIKNSNESVLDKTNDELVNLFLKSKEIEGCSAKTIKYYKLIINSALKLLNKPLQHIATEDLRDYIAKYQEGKSLSKVTIDNVRRVLSSIFSWLEEENYILKSPMKRIHRVKITKEVKETFSDEDIEKMRDNCENNRDLAIIDILTSTGMRVGELVNLNKDDINFNERECIVLGKGDKERIVYLDAKAKIHIQNYLNERKDSNEALFIMNKAPFARLQIGGIERILKNLGEKLSINRVHPHKFRRTLATIAIDKGMPIEQLQRLLGHQRIDTTLQYAMVKQNNVKNAHRKFIG